MVVDLDIDDVTNSPLVEDGVTDGTGTFDILMNKVSAYIEDQSQKGRLKGPDYANVLLGSIQAVLAQSMQYELQESKIEAEINEMTLNGEADRALKVAQLALVEKDLDLKEAELDIREKELAIKEYEFTEMMPLQKDKLASDIELTDAQIVGIGYDNQVKAEEVTMSEFQREFIQPKELEKVTAEISLMSKDEELKDAQIVGMGYDNQVKAEQVTMSEFQREFIQPKELEKITAEVSLMAKDEDVKDAQIIGMGYDNEVKEEQVKMSEFEREFIQPKQLDKLEEEIDLLETQDSELQLNGAKDRLLKDEQIGKVAAETELTEEKQSTEQYSQQALKAKVEDENGMLVTEDSVAYSSSPETQHYWAVKTAEEGYEKAGHDTDAAEEGVETVKAANRIAEAKLNLDYNKKVDPSNEDVLVNYSTIPTSTALDSTWLDTKIPETNFELALLKARTEAQVATRTAEGYQADTYYKIYRSLQELMFALTNAGIISSEDDNGIYGRIVTGMEEAMNAQAGVWATGSFNIDLDGE